MKQVRVADGIAPGDSTDIAARIEMPYDTQKDFAPASFVTRVSNVKMEIYSPLSVPPIASVVPGYAAESRFVLVAPQKAPDAIVE